ncbi:MAG TPA: NfeD family protein [Microcoleaceae cyanobacterium]|jgi:membrane protein implicated in regulation of membrane protease activity
MPLSPTLIWLLAGAGLCLAELVFPTAFVAFMLGISALIVAAVASFIPFNLQVLLWMVVSLLLVVASRRLVRQRAAFKLDATEAETLTEIAAGKTGRVLYEGNSWLARCSDWECTIANWPPDLRSSFPS